MTIHKRAICSLIMSLGATLGIGGCSSQTAPTAAEPTPPAAGQSPAPAAAGSAPQYRLTASIQELMEGQIDPSADALWDSVAYISTKAGAEDRQPRTDEEWKAVRTSAITLMEATNLLSMPGRHVDVTDKPVGLGELPPAQIQQRIDGTHASFVQFAQGLQEAARQALTAIDAKNPQALMDAGGAIDEACEACHVTYWYPNQNRPGS